MDNIGYDKNTDGDITLTIKHIPQHVPGENSGRDAWEGSHSCPTAAESGDAISNDLQVSPCWDGTTCAASPDACKALYLNTAGSIGYGDINIELDPLCNFAYERDNVVVNTYHADGVTITGTTTHETNFKVFVEDSAGKCQCNPLVSGGQNYDANSKQCCHSSCSRCYGPSKEECIFTLDSKCGEVEVGEPQSCATADLFLQYYGGLGKCGTSTEFSKEIADTTTNWNWAIPVDQESTAFQGIL